MGGASVDRAQPPPPLGLTLRPLSTGPSADHKPYPPFPKARTGSGGGGTPPPILLRRTAILMHPWSHPQGCIRKEGTSEVAPEAVRQAVGGDCPSGWGGYCRLQMPSTRALAVRGTVAGQRRAQRTVPPPTSVRLCPSRRLQRMRGTLALPAVLHGAVV